MNLFFTLYLKTFPSDDAADAASSRAEEPRNLTPQNAFENRQRTPSISSNDDPADDPSAAWNESSKAPSLGKSVSYADDIVQKKSRTPSITEDDSETESAPQGGDESDDWMDDLDEALAKQGYNGL